MFSLKGLSFGKLCFALFLFIFVSGIAQSVAASTISGFVYGPGRKGVDEVDVELLNENRNVLDRMKTNSVGRYSFNVVSDGRYYIRVLPFRYNFIDQTKEIMVETLSQRGQGIGFFQLDFYLKLKKGGLADTTTGVVFAQEVPKNAEDQYKLAMKDLSDKKASDGMNRLIKAIRIFPKYYAASQRLGIELMKADEFLEATNLFMRAAEINPKSSRAFYYMAFSLNRLGKKYNRAALKALQKATVLAPASWEVAFLVGKIHRQEGNFLEAEKQLVRSKKLVRVKKPSIHIELAQLYANDMKKFGKAADELELYLKSVGKKDEKIKKQIADLRNKARRTS
ncbi:MAG: hypothetical protein HKN25_17340 [Pyrinomonadaceae bacterium]|nr:hypothetical protein [Pyrinomonadaceae bacterium]